MTRKQTRDGHYARKMTLTQLLTARELYRNGWTLQRIADLYGVTKQALSKTMRRRDVQMRPRHPLTRDELGRVLPLRPEAPARYERDGIGVIATLREQRSGELHTVYAAGYRLDALLYVAELCDAMHGVWRVLSYSTPETILADMDGRRRLTRNVAPEVQMLSRIDRLDLLDPQVRR